MKKVFGLLTLISVIMVFSSCQSTGFLMAKAKVTMINEPYPAKEENANIEVFITNLPSEVYIELAQITCNDTVDDWCLKQIKIKAREIGADGIIILGKSTSNGVGIPIGNMYYVLSEGYGMKAIAFKYR